MQNQPIVETTDWNMETLVKFAKIETFLMHKVTMPFFEGLGSIKIIIKLNLLTFYLFSYKIDMSGTTNQKLS